MPSSKPLVLGFGYEAQSGKDECCKHLMKLYKGSKIIHTSFAKRLRKELHGEMYQLVADLHLTPREALREMCERAGVEWDPFAVRDEKNLHGKQRKLQQWFGTELKRKQDPNYWISWVQKEIEDSGADLVLISDVRFINEANWIKSLGGKTVHVSRLNKKSIGDASGHSSEQQLTNYAWDYVLENDGGLKDLHKKAADLYRGILQLDLF